MTALGTDQEASGVGATGDEVATAIQLHAHLPRGVSFDLSSVNFRLGCSLDDVLLLFHSRYWSLPRSIPEAVRWHPQAEVFRHLAGMPLPGPISATDPGWQYFELFTDASFDGSVSSWAFIVLGWRAGAVHFVAGWLTLSGLTLALVLYRGYRSRCPQWGGFCSLLGSCLGCTRPTLGRHSDLV